MAEAGASAAAGSQAITFELALSANHAGESLGLGYGGIVGDVIAERIASSVVVDGVFVDGTATGMAIVRRRSHIGRGRQSTEVNVVRLTKRYITADGDVVEPGTNGSAVIGRPDAPDTGGSGGETKRQPAGSR